MTVRALPTLTPSSDFYATMKKWQQTLRPLLLVSQPPSVVLLLFAKGMTNGVLVSWSVGNSQSGVDGFVLQRSDNGNFTQNVISFNFPSGQQTSYFDALGANGITKYYRLIATSGTQANPQQAQSKPSGVISATSGSGSTTYDSTQTGNPAKNPAGTGYPRINNPRVRNPDPNNT